ncbi:hypothetical protein Y032_0138g2047 [Ancylostoma ceylanicum]|uniref:Uncharacterized protein n=1 Tax=Ancylostoma ceylanicum TaxID=53326 RepID=A0A016T4W1_9BILA|nr:hypothetical protein Y032_0138g2047 [Ancylostoma ceylanicum]
MGISLILTVSERIARISVSFDYCVCRERSDHSPTLALPHRGGRRSNMKMADVGRIPGRTDRLQRCTGVRSTATETRLADLETIRIKVVAGRWTNLFSGVGSSRFSARKIRNKSFVSVR